MATSAEKRKWRRQQQQKSKKPRIDQKILEEEIGIKTSVKAPDATDSSNIQQILFLVLFPLLMTSIVVLTREDLREEAQQKGIGRFLKEWRTDKAIKHEERLQQTSGSTPSSEEA
jgi:hypothetical protein